MNFIFTIHSYITWKISILDYNLIKNSPASLYSSRYIENVNSNGRNIQAGTSPASYVCIVACHRNQLTSLQGTTITSECVKMTGESKEIAMSTVKPTIA